MRSHYPRLSGEDAEDLVSEAIQRILEAQETGDLLVQNDDSYFRSVLANTAADMHRKRTGRGSQTSPRRSQVEFDQEIHAAAVHDFDRPEERAVAASGVELVASALVEMRRSSLKYDRLQAELIRLRHCEQLDVPAVMAQLGFQNRKKYESHHTRGIHKLRERIANLGRSRQCSLSKQLVQASAQRNLEPDEVATLEAHMSECVACSMAYWLAREPDRVLAGIALPALGWVGERWTYLQGLWADRLPTVDGSRTSALATRFGELVARFSEGTSAATKTMVVGCAGILCAGAGISVVESEKQERPTRAEMAQSVTPESSQAVSSEPAVSRRSLDDSAQTRSKETRTPTRERKREVSVTGSPQSSDSDARKQSSSSEESKAKHETANSSSEAKKESTTDSDKAAEPGNSSSSTSPGNSAATPASSHAASPANSTASDVNSVVSKTPANPAQVELPQAVDNAADKVQNAVDHATNKVEHATDNLLNGLLNH